LHWEKYKATLFAIQEKTNLLVILLTNSDKSVIPMFATKITNKIFTIVVPFILLLEDWEYCLKLADLFYNVFKPNMHNFSNIFIILTITDIIVMFDFAKVIGYSFTNCIFRGLVLNKVYKVYVLRDFRIYIRSI